MITEIIELRHKLHQNPEVSNNEFKTSKRIADFINPLAPSKVIPLSKTGLAFVFNGQNPGKTTMFRSELDALPIAEKSALPYASIHKNVAHVCGHDGHMAILAGLAQKIAKNPPKYGKVVLLYQPAEEVEQGAKDVMEDPRFKEIEPDGIFALHNIPGIKKHSIVLKGGSFSAASKGMTIQLFGKTAHAAEPENGISPASAISKIINQLHQLKENKSLFKDLALLTIIHIQLGEISFGTTPGYAEIRVTLRSFENEDMEVLTLQAEKIINEISKAENLECKISYSEEFPASVNNDACVSYVKQAAKENNLVIENINKPFKWSEDFGYYAQKYNSCLFGLGSGITQPPLHNPDFNFPDEIIETGIKTFYNIYQKINLNNDR
ncbi:MAG: amidohydrolase [Lutibacter sp.]|uniref:amidohydrolase n=1 Tax=Lutibacter sp. TaxID=1925666 RepID=UPI00299EBADC|nr:amidohydrolase [Lutibacter sp.]MDX1828628.1 amidohydrolase [Lutibacter sp.]